MLVSYGCVPGSLGILVVSVRKIIVFICQCGGDVLFRIFMPTKNKINKKSIGLQRVGGSTQVANLTVVI